MSDPILDAVFFLFYTAVMLFLGWIVGRLGRPSEWDTAYKKGLEDADKGWKSSLSKDQPFKCQAIPLDPFRSLH